MGICSLSGPTWLGAGRQFPGAYSSIQSGRSVLGGCQGRQAEVGGSTCQCWLPGPSTSLSLLWDSSVGLSRRCSSRKLVMSLAIASTSLGQQHRRKGDHSVSRQLAATPFLPRCRPQFTPAVAHDCALGQGMGEACGKAQHSHVALAEVAHLLLLHVHVADVMEQDHHCGHDQVTTRTCPV